jgi:hypothetical protein
MPALAAWPRSGREDHSMSHRIVPTSDRTIHWMATVKGGPFVASGVTVVAVMPVDAQTTKTARAPAAAYGLPIP